MDNQILLDELLCVAKQKYPLVQGKLIQPQQLIFQEWVKMSCFYCGKYNSNWKCPPRLPEKIDFEKMVREFPVGAFIFSRTPFSEKDYGEVRNTSSLHLHKAILMMENHLWKNNIKKYLSFIGGSCKLCKNGCGKEKCNNPYQARTPLEAIGVDVIDSAMQYGIAIHFPPEKSILRLGLILWK